MRKIVYPIFLICRNQVHDLFWKKVFENLAYGEAPKGVTLEQNRLCSKKKEFDYSFSEKDPDQICQELVNIFSTTFGLKVKSDLSRKKEIFEQFQKTNSSRKEEDVWGKIKKRSLKENLLQDFVLEMGKKYSLSLEQKRKLHFFLSAGLTFKIFQSSDIQMKNGIIESVRGVEFQPGQLFIDRYFPEPTIKVVPEGRIDLVGLWKGGKIAED